MPSLIKVQELFDGNPGTQGWVMIGMVDAELNDVSPYGTDWAGTRRYVCTLGWSEELGF